MTSYCWPEVSVAYLEGKLIVNREKSRIVSLASNRGSFKFLGFNIGKAEMVSSTSMFIRNQRISSKPNLKI